MLLGGQVLNLMHVWNLNWKKVAYYPFKIEQKHPQFLNLKFILFSAEKSFPLNSEMEQNFLS